jgi:hypothetical protein
LRVTDPSYPVTDPQRVQDSIFESCLGRRSDQKTRSKGSIAAIPPPITLAAKGLYLKRVIHCCDFTADPV